MRWDNNGSIEGLTDKKYEELDNEVIDDINKIDYDKCSWKASYYL